MNYEMMWKRLEYEIDVELIKSKRSNNYSFTYHINMLKEILEKIKTECMCKSLEEAGY